MSTIADSLSPEVIEQLSSAWLMDLDLIEVDTYIPEFCSAEQAERDVGLTSGQYLWHQAWLFGIVVDDDLGWYIPDDYDTRVPLVSLDNPPLLPLGGESVV